jgi:NAD(P)-dependent dehydrogenase (short-subunit alcohol dehydrogenase family)
MSTPLASLFSLDGKRALVTGAGRGLGLASARALAEAGASVTLCARSVMEIEREAALIATAGGNADCLVADVTQVEDFAQAVASQGPFDIFVNNAGTNRPGPFIEASPADFDAVMTINMRAAFFAAQAVARGLLASKRPGSIINMSSQMGHVGAVNRTIYCASKHALEGLTKAMAVELGAAGIRVNTICPTFIETPMTRPFLENPEFRASVLSKIKLGRLGRPQDIVGAVVFLAGNASALMTGSSLVVDGGWTAD